MNPEISRTFPKNNAHKCARRTKQKKQQIGIKNSGLLLFCYQNIKGTVKNYAQKGLQTPAE